MMRGRAIVLLVAVVLALPSAAPQPCAAGPSERPESGTAGGCHGAAPAGATLSPGPGSADCCCGVAGAVLLCAHSCSGAAVLVHGGGASVAAPASGVAGLPAPAPPSLFASRIEHVPLRG